jgi:demethylmenaquinone methyltransferase / 2-methoxy-6-polyprenyl-1,4-benzoquinol methylase
MSEQVHKMFSQIAPRYDIANDLMSFGTHRLWKQKAVRLSQASAGQAVLDCATGTGDVAIAFKRAVGSTGRVVGTDFNAEMLKTAPDKAKSQSLDIVFEVADAMKLPYPSASFDISSISFGIRNVDDPVQALKEMSRVVKPGGRVVVLEFGQPTGLFGLVFQPYARFVMPTLGHLVSGNRSAYEYLPRTAAAFPANERFLKLMQDAKSFASTSAHPLMSGLAYIYVGIVK